MKDPATNKNWGSYIGPSDIKRDLNISVGTAIKWIEQGLFGPVLSIPCGKEGTTSRRILVSEYIKFKERRTYVPTQKKTNQQ